MGLAMAKGSKKPTAKSPKAKPKPPEAPPEKVLLYKAPPGYQLPLAMKELAAEAERYHRPRLDPKRLAEGRAWLDSLIPQPTPPAQPTTAQVALSEQSTTAQVTPPVEPAVVPAKRERKAWQVCHALEILPLLFPRDKCPDGVPVAMTTKDLGWEIGRRSKLEAAKRGTKPLPTPGWDAVKEARRQFNQMRSTPP
jgi:hypothetical protein